MCQPCYTSASLATGIERKYRIITLQTQAFDTFYNAELAANTRSVLRQWGWSDQGKVAEVNPEIMTSFTNVSGWVEVRVIHSLSNIGVHWQSLVFWCHWH
jgi:hypothetical protein